MSTMAADSFHPPSEVMTDVFLSALAAKWREMKDAPAPGGAGMVFRPAREAAEMRRLCRGALAAGAPVDVIARMWRSLCGDVAVARGLKQVFVAGGDVSLTLEAGRSYFGFGPDLVPLVGVRDALERTIATPSTLACIPWPETPGAGQWWPMLNESRYQDLMIVAGWPSLPGNPSDALRVAIVGKVPVETSGDDDTLVTAHDDQWTVDKRLLEVGIKGEVVSRARSLALVRIPEFIAPDDRRIDLLRKAGLDGLRVIGVRPRP
jgi:hypothetical protein